MSKKLNDREMLLLAYGALKAASLDDENLQIVVKMVEEHLFPEGENEKRPVDEVVPPAAAPAVEPEAPPAEVAPAAPTDVPAKGSE